MRDLRRSRKFALEKLKKIGLFSFSIKLIELTIFSILSLNQIKFRWRNSLKVNDFLYSQIFEEIYNDSKQIIDPEISEKVALELANYKYRVFGRLFSFSSLNNKENHINNKELTPILEILKDVENNLSKNFSGYKKNKSIAWNLDPLHNFNFTKKQINYGKSEIKIPWELGRFSVFPWLASSDVKKDIVCNLFLRDCCQFIISNDTSDTIQWSNAMEAGIRIHNIVLTTNILKSRNAYWNDRYDNLISSLERMHRKYILFNLEFSFLQTSNHFASNLLGLSSTISRKNKILLSLVKNIFSAEINKNVPKTFLNEGSTAYHRFTTEVYLYTTFWLRLKLGSIDSNITEKISSMVELTHSIENPLGLHTLFGDADGGYVNHSFFPYKASELMFSPYFVKNHLNLIRILARATGVRNINKLRREISNYGEIIVIRKDKLYICINNLKESKKTINNTHFHDDHGFTEIFDNDLCISIDSGMNFYTSNPKEHRFYRSAASHFSNANLIEDGIIFENISRRNAQIKIEHSKDIMKCNISFNNERYFELNIMNRIVDYSYNKNLITDKVLFLNYLGQNYFEQNT